MPETTDKRPRKKYTAEFKADAVQLATAPNVTIAQTARDLGIGDTLLRVRIKAAGKPPEGLTDSERTSWPNFVVKIVG